MESSEAIEPKGGAQKLTCVLTKYIRVCLGLLKSLLARLYLCE